jgi:hypothetical protein
VRGGLRRYSISGQFDLSASPLSLTLSSATTQVFRDGSASAPVFATCTQTESFAGTRAGD